MRLIIALALTASLLPAQKFYPDDPLLVEPAPLDTKNPARRKLSDWYDLFSHIFATPGEKQPATGAKIHARNVNTLGDPMDGAWYTRRHYFKPMSADELRRGPGGLTPPEFPWTIVGAKGEGITPGFTVVDAKRRRFFVKLDPITNPEMMTAAEMIGSRFFHALGYHVPDNYIVEFNPSQLKIADKLQYTDQRGIERPFRPRDLTELLIKAPRLKDGGYRAIASLAVDGKPLGPFRFFGQRSDDPNDTVPHEHRRELRAYSVFCAWLGHEDSRAINTFDALVTSGGRSFIRHYLMDFGSTLGSASDGENSPRSGDYHFTWRGSAAQLFSLGLVVPYWARAHYPDYPSLGRFESHVFDPVRWVPEYPNPAFLNRLADDEFWAAKQVMAFSNQDIAALVSTGQLSDKQAERYLIECLIERRDKIGRAFYSKLLPIDRFRLDNGQLAFDDLSRNSGPFNIAWHEFDNSTGALGPTTKAASGRRVAVVTGSRPAAQSVRVYLHDSRIIGVERTW